MNSPDQKHVLITGAGRGIGAAIAEKFSQQGYRVSLLGRAMDTLREQAEQLGDESLPLACDITDVGEVERAFKTAQDTFGPIDCLVNNAGVAQTAPFMKTSAEQLRFLFEVNVIGASNCIQQILPKMLERNSGRIINIGSTSGVKGYSYTSAYTSSKHALMGLMRCIAAEISHSQVTINTVCPGFTQTDIVDAAIENIVSKTGRNEAEAIAELTKHNPQKRFVQPSEVADTVFFLSENVPLSLNGQAIMLDGGETN